MAMTIRSPAARLARVAGALALLAGGCGGEPPAVDEARAFLDQAESRLLDAWAKAGRAAWIRSTYVTADTTALAAEARAEAIGLAVELAAAAARFDGSELPRDLRRKLLKLKTSPAAATPADPALRTELSNIAAEMEAAYDRRRFCPDGGDDCLLLTDLEERFAEVRDTDELLDLWLGWRAAAAPMRGAYARFAELADAGARDLGFSDLGELWRSGYDMPPEAFAAEVDRLWRQVRPLYESLHCHVRASLADEYGSAIVPPDGPIPAHLLGDPRGRTWVNVFDLAAPRQTRPGYDLTGLLEDAGVGEVEMVRYAESFFSSLGFEALPDTFWERSLFVRPADREVDCRAAARNLDRDSDLRIRMCLDVNGEDFVAVHHALGRSYYQRAYRGRSPLFRAAAHDGFHEGFGDAVVLSMTPGYLVETGLLDEAPPADRDIGLLLGLALDKVAVLPFDLLVDQWRWRVFSGEIRPEAWNEGWWDLRTAVQGVAPPTPRSEADFDPGAEHHVLAAESRMRHFLGGILQFQFHRALCEAAGREGPLHRCSVFGSREAGRRLQAMLEIGASRPWPEVLQRGTGRREMDATAVLDYFAPLQAWLDERNAGRSCGWGRG